jgi:hypothetical protein
MIVSRQKKKENIVEYLMYMWHVEDLLRACRFDRGEIEKHIISSYQQPEDVLQEIRQWYQGLIDSALAEGIMEKGHLQANNHIVAELTALHNRLLLSPRETLYSSIYYKTLPAIVQLRSKAGDTRTSEIETCLTAVYGYFLLKIQKKEISPETAESVKQISNLLTCLAAKYHEE